MRYIFFFLFFCLSLHLQALDTVRIIVPDGYHEIIYQDDTIFYAIQDKENLVGQGTGVFGQVEFTPDSTSGWEFQWSYEGANQSVSYREDSTVLTVNLIGNGFYSFRAEKGSEVIQKEFIVYYVFLDYKISLADTMNCDYIRIDIDTLSIPRYGLFPGPANPQYTVIWNGQERILQSIPEYYTQISQWIAGENQNVKAKIKIQDKFGFEWESNEVEYISMIPKAGFTLDISDALGDKAGEAPLEVNFKDGSVNAQDWEWHLYKDTTYLTELSFTLYDSLLDEQICYGKELSYIYMYPGYYGVRQVVINTMGDNRCTDTSTVEYITVYPSLVEVPNVFTPNGDGINDIFRVKTHSVESFHAIILNRWEKIVYEWKDPEGGWDGRIKGKEASPGTYYYIIRAKGREQNAPPRYIKKGSLLLVR